MVGAAYNVPGETERGEERSHMDSTRSRWSRICIPPVNESGDCLRGDDGAAENET